MKRTTVVILTGVLWAGVRIAAQEPGAAVGENAQATPFQELVASVRAAEQAVQSLRLTMTTAAREPGGIDVTTRGELRVLRGTQPGAPPSMFTRVQYRFGEGLSGTVESAETEAGVVMYEEDPAFGAMLLRFDRELVVDLAWAGEVLGQSDLPGMPDRRATSPLGSGMLQDLARTFELAIDARTEHGGEAGTWVAGRRKPGLDDQDPDLPLADRVELFVRGRDKALLAARWYVGDDIVQRLDVESLELGVPLGVRQFEVDGRGLRARDVRSYQPMWAEIEQILKRAEAKAEGGQVRPSKR